VKGELGDDDEFAQLQDSGDHGLAELGEVVLVAAAFEYKLRSLYHSTWRRPMLNDHLKHPTAIRVQFGAICCGENYVA
jgi:hypothetical protein